MTQIRKQVTLRIQAPRTAWGRSSVSDILLVEVCSERHISCENLFFLQTRNQFCWQSSLPLCTQKNVRERRWNLVWKLGALLLGNDLGWFDLCKCFNLVLNMCFIFLKEP